jgi:hypothetical protein
MKFVVVNDRAARAAKCAHCAKSIGVGYLHEIQSRRFYCDNQCYIADKARVAPIDSRAGSDIDQLVIGGFKDPYSFVFGS